jgi:hypothetical protein
MKAGERVRAAPTLWNHLRGGQPYVVFLTIWGSQWIVSSFMDFIGQWQDVVLWQQLTLWLAMGISLWALPRSLRSGKRNTWTHPASGTGLLPLLMGLASVFVLVYVQAGSPLFTPLLRSFILAIGYAQLGAWLGRPLVYMSLWLFTLTVVVALWYLGFASMILGFFGGLSMLALGRIFYTGSKQAEGNLG